MLDNFQIWFILHVIVTKTRIKILHVYLLFHSKFAYILRGVSRTPLIIFKNFVWGFNTTSAVLVKMCWI